MADVFVNPDSEKSESLAKRGFVFLEDGSWEIADKYFERALEISPENAEAYLGKLMVELKIPKKEVFKNYREPFDEMENYKNFIRFADGKLKEEIEGYNTFVKERKITEQKEKIYIRATAMMHSALTEGKLIKAAETFESISDYKDADEMVDKCLQKAKTLVQEQEQKKAAEEKERKKKSLVTKVVVPVSILAVIIGVIFYFVVLSPILEENKYNNAVEAMANGEYSDAIRAFDELGDYADSFVRRKEASRLNMAKDSFSLSFNHIVAIRKDGKVVADGDKQFDYGQLDVEDWKDVVSVKAGRSHTVGLKKDGTVVATGNNESGECDVSVWGDIVDIAVGPYCTIGVRSDGRVVLTREFSENNFDYKVYKGKVPISEWENIVSVSMGSSHIVGLKSDGTVLAVGAHSDGQQKVYGWRNIVDVVATGNYTVGLKEDGTVVTTTKGNYTYALIDVSDWTDIVAISAYGDCVVGLKSDGTVVATGSNTFGQCDVENWTDIIAVEVAHSYTVGIKSDGTIVVTGNYEEIFDIKGLKNIKLPE